MFNPQSLLSAFVPAPYKPLLACVSPNALKVIEWKPVLSDAALLAKRLATGEGVDQLEKELLPFLPGKLRFGVAESGSRASNLNSEDGAVILELYFSQFKNKTGQFLDLRPSHFSKDDKGQVLWYPNGLWWNFSADFRDGMLAVYQGYYLEKPPLLREGLKRVGLIREGFPESLVSQVEEMILGHIGGETSSQQFKVLHFTESFEKLFQFLLKEKIILSQDFLYLGIYLAGLYMHLEKLGGYYDVKNAFLASKTEFKN